MEVSKAIAAFPKGWRARTTLLTVALAAALLVPVLSAAGSEAAIRTIGLQGWQVQSSAQTPAPGAQVSQPWFSASSWLQVRPDDAGAPGTEVAALVQNNHCPAVFFSRRMADCFGYMNKIGADTIPQFSVPWWFRTSFWSQGGRGRYASLVVNGVIGEADVWVDAHEVATHATVHAAFTRFTFPLA